MAARLSIRHAAPAVAVLAAAVLAVGCGGDDIPFEEGTAAREAAVLFEENCGMCHTFDWAASRGTSVNVNELERVDGPNFNQRKEKVEAVLYAIRNGGFSGAIMPANIVTGEEARLVAEFVARYAGRPFLPTIEQPAPDVRGR
ncbi:MAG TPA: cytochrome c [Solirubrobacteraceae bacterium]|nr:cytochrome c [Solirubrobacteraceae bacterium]